MIKRIRELRTPDAPIPVWEQSPSAQAAAERPQTRRESQPTDGKAFCRLFSECGDERRRTRL